MSQSLRLFLLSFLMLFAELTLIRWLGSNEIYLSYFSNFVLLGSFLGIGIGFLIAEAKWDVFSFSAPMLAFVIAFPICFPVIVNRTGYDLIFFGGDSIQGLPMWLVLPLAFCMTAIAMAFIAQGVARAFRQFRPLDAYRLDILGSIAGIAAFSALSQLSFAPFAWGCVIAATLSTLYWPKITLTQGAGCLALLVILAKMSFYPGTLWSPYYRITLWPIDSRAYQLYVNGIPHQDILPTATRKKYMPIYFTVYDRIAKNALTNVLIVGAGTGGDVAIALAAGAKHIDAVEIDPGIYGLGKALNPERPYQNDNVTVHIGDGRAYLQRTHTKYDLILFALPDSLMLVSGQSSLRLESYLFTLNSLRAAREDLKPGGAFAMYNYYREQWLVDRYANTIRTVFGSSPCIDTATGKGRFALLVAGRSPLDVRCRAVWSSETTPVPEPVSDDRPFPYLRAPSLPQLYVVSLAGILLISLVAIGAMGGSLVKMGNYLDLFFLGTAFLLLETKNVVQFALLFGTTWFVNALVFAGSLTAVYLAVEVARRWRTPPMTMLYGALFVSIIATFFIQPESLLALDMLPRLVAACTTAFLPIFFANLIFAQRFASVATSTVAFATNLLGAMLGGVIEYASLIIGYQLLLLVVLGLYVAAGVSSRLCYRS